MADWSTLVAALLGGGFIAGVVEVVKTFANRRVRAATVVDQLSDTALEQVRQAVADAHEARMEARQARQDADSARREAVEARREATDARREAMDLARSMSRLKTAILSPYATVDALRAMVTDPPSANGSGTALIPR